MKKIWKILPLFVVEWMARKACERMMIFGERWCIAYEDVLIKE